MAQVHVGDRDFTITEFSGYKFLEATELLGHMLEIVPELDSALAKFGQEWRDSNPARTIDRAAAELEFGDAAQTISEDAWTATGGKLTITPRPDGQQVFLRMFPKLQRHARKDITKMLALVVTPNSELEDADQAGQDIYAPDGCVGRNQRFLLHKGTPTQLVKVALAAMEAMGDELREGDLLGAVGKLRERWEEMLGTQKTQPGSDDAPNRAARRHAADAPASSRTSSGSTRAASRASKSSTASPTAT